MWTHTKSSRELRWVIKSVDQGLMVHHVRAVKPTSGVKVAAFEAARPFDATPHAPWALQFRLPDALVAAPAWVAGALVALHAVSIPAAIVGMNLYQGPALYEAQEVRRAVRTKNAEALDAIWEIISTMYYGERLSLRGLEQTIAALSDEEIARGLSSESEMEALAERIVRGTGDPYSGYASLTKLATPPLVSPYGLRLQRLPPPSPRPLPLPSAAPERAWPALHAGGGWPASSMLAKSMDVGPTPPTLKEVADGRGLLVAAIAPHSAAELAGLRMGDVVLRMSGGQAEEGVDEFFELIPVGGGAEELTLHVQSAGSAPRSVVFAEQPPQQPQVRPPLVYARQLREDEVLSPDSLSSDAIFPPAVGLRAQRLASRASSLGRGSSPSGGGGRVGYVRLASFSEEATGALFRNLEQLEARGCVGYVLDLRNNGGGQMREAMVDASAMLGFSDATVAYTVDANGLMTRHTVASILDSAAPPSSTTSRSSVASLSPAPPSPTASPSASPTASPSASPAASLSPVAFSSPQQDPHEHPPFSIDPPLSTDPPLSLLPPERPLVLLVDRGTASAAELFSAAMHDNGHALLLGEATYGKSLVQRVFPLPNGGALKLTIGEYLRPTQQRIERGSGLRPDIMCTSTPNAADSDTCVERAAGLVAAAAAAPAQHALHSILPQSDTAHPAALP